MIISLVITLNRRINTYGNILVSSVPEQRKQLLFDFMLLFELIITFNFRQIEYELLRH